MPSTCWWGFSWWQQIRATLKQTPPKCAWCGRWLFMSSTDLILLWSTASRRSPSLMWAPVQGKEVTLVPSSFHLSSLAACFHIFNSCVKSQLLQGLFSLLSFSSLNKTAWHVWLFWDFYLKNLHNFCINVSHRNWKHKSQINKHDLEVVHSRKFS